MATRRMERMARSVQEEVSRIILYEMSDPRMRFATVTNVEMSPDLRSAKINVSILGSDEDVRTALRGLNHAKGHVQHLLGNRLPGKFTPVISFNLDPSVRRSIEMSKLIDDAVADSPFKEKVDDAEDISENGPDKATDTHDD